MIRVGVLGCGFIGGQICRAVRDGQIAVDLCGIYDVSPEKAEQLSREIGMPDLFRRTPADIFNETDLVIECASQKAAREIILPALDAGCDVMVMSAGVFQDEDFYRAVREKAIRKNRKIYMPSGAIGGTDAIRSAASAEITSVSLTTRKPAAGLKDAPYVIENGIDLSDLKEPRTLFDGKARDAVRAFPKNVNVCATLSLCGIGFDKTHVRIVADPTIHENIHEIEVTGDFGKFRMRIANKPSPQNPRTSSLAALSAIAMLKRIADPFRIG